MTVTGLLPNARLLTVAGWGHASLFLSQCTDSAAADYLLNVTVPPEGTVCMQDYVPFSTLPASAAATEDTAGRASLTPAQVLDVVRRHVR